MSKAFYDLKRRCLAITKNHPIDLLCSLLLEKKKKDHLQNQLGKVPSSFPVYPTRFETSQQLSLRFQRTPGYKEDATTQRFFSAGLTEDSVSFGSLQANVAATEPSKKPKGLVDFFGFVFVVVTAETINSYESIMVHFWFWSVFLRVFARIHWKRQSLGYGMCVAGGSIYDPPLFISPK